MNFIKKALKAMVVIMGLLAVAIVIIGETHSSNRASAAAPASPAVAVEKYQFENYYRKDPALARMIDELNFIVPGKPIFLLNTDNGKPMFPGSLTLPKGRDMNFAAPDRKNLMVAKGSLVLGNVHMSHVVENNICVISLSLKSIGEANKKRVSAKQNQLILTLAHEVVHCAQADYALSTVRLLSPVLEIYRDGGGTAGTKRDRVTSAHTINGETFVAAYFLALATNSNGDSFIEKIADDAWESEYSRISLGRYNNSLGFISGHCKIKGMCPTDVEKLHHHLLSQPGYLNAIALDLPSVLALKLGRDMANAVN